VARRAAGLDPDLLQTDQHSVAAAQAQLARGAFEPGTSAAMAWPPMAVAGPVSSDSWVLFHIPPAGRRAAGSAATLFDKQVGLQPTAITLRGPFHERCWC
jgi:hypothetical protein